MSENSRKEENINKRNAWLLPSLFLNADIFRVLSFCFHRLSAHNTLKMCCILSTDRSRCFFVVVVVVVVVNSVMELVQTNGNTGEKGSLSLSLF